MSSTAGSSADTSTETPEVGTIEMGLEVVTLPVSDVDRAKRFYESLGWRTDADIVVGDSFRVVQMTPTRSACSIAFGKGLTTAEPGSAQRLILVVSDIDAARDDLIARGADVSELFHLDGGPVPGRDPQGRSYQTLATFGDPDGNKWLLQEITTRLPGRIDTTETTYGSTVDLEGALRRAAAAHGEHERRAGGQYDANWPEWYAAYMVAEHAGTELPT
jgi:catechol 2,3-dioxygenase-like lactoylglutathione lyase family enzyme